jgi:enamine deaminase RidA (YjgF/YER057c/UK114 family)
MEWATLAGGVLYSVHVPILPDGTFETGAAEAQIARALDNLEQAVEAARGTLADVAQVLV